MLNRFQGTAARRSAALWSKSVSTTQNLAIASLLSLVERYEIENLLPFDSGRLLMLSDDIYSEKRS